MNDKKIDFTTLWISQSIMIDLFLMIKNKHKIFEFGFTNESDLFDRFAFILYF